MSSSQTSEHSITIAIQLPNTSGYSFRTFGSYPEFQAWHLSTPDSSHYEVIQGKQNLYFDFDGDLDIDALTNSIKQYYAQLEKTTNRPLPIRVDVYSSSDSIKKSFHVVVKGVCFHNHTSCGQAARNIISLAHAQRNANSQPRNGLLGSQDADTTSHDMKPDWTAAFDSSVYSAKRNLRLLGSRKLNSTRVKIFVGTSYKSPSFTSRFESDQLFLSLIGCTSECQLVLLDTLSSQVVAGRVDSEQLSSEMVRDAMMLMNDLLPGIFSQREIRGRTLFLKRNKPAICPVCERLHESDNAMVSLRNRGPEGPVLHFICMRDTSRSLPLQSDEEVVLPLRLDGVILPATGTGETRSAIELYAEKVVRRWGFTV